MNKRWILAAMAAGMMAQSQAAPKTPTFEEAFADSTLRVDYAFAGVIGPDGKAQCDVAVEALARSDGWAGRRHRLTELPLLGQGQITMVDEATGDTIYRTSFSTLFQEWIADGKESKEVKRSFQNVFLVPLPHRPALITLNLNDSGQRSMASLTHRVDPQDILIQDMSSRTPLPHRYIHRGGDPREAIDVAILAEGYTQEEMDSFYVHAERAVEALRSHEPFKSEMDRLNFVAVASPSADSGVSVPRLGEWKQTAVGAHYSTFYSDRYLTTPNLRAVHDCLTGIPYEHIIILANSDEYGGGGIYNLYTLTTARNPSFRPVVVHEFGHSFGGLGDEYFYEYDAATTANYPEGVEPWEPNLTTLTDFGSKWASLLAPGTPRPTPPAEADRWPVGLYEGGGYASKGIYRPADDCRMRTNTSPAFCPACEAALRALIRFYSE